MELTPWSIRMKICNKFHLIVIQWLSKRSSSIFCIVFNPSKALKPQWCNELLRVKETGGTLKEHDSYVDDWFCMYLFKIGIDWKAGKWNNREFRHKKKWAYNLRINLAISAVKLWFRVENHIRRLNSPWQYTIDESSSEHLLCIYLQKIQSEAVLLQ